MRNLNRNPPERSAIAPTLFSPEGFAQSLGISRATVYRAMKAGELKAKKLGRRTVIEPSAGQAYIAALPDRQSAA